MGICKGNCRCRIGAGDGEPAGWLETRQLRSKWGTTDTEDCRPWNRYVAVADDAHRPILAHLPHDDAHVIRRTDGNRATESDCKVLQRGQGHRDLRDVRSRISDPDRSHSQWAHSPILGLGIRSPRAGEHNVCGIHARSGCGVPPAATRRSSCLVHRTLRPVLLRLGEIFSLFPSITADLFGAKWATTNFGVVLTGAGVASIFAGPIAAMASVKSGNWTSVFWAMIACDIISALLALVWLKPIARRMLPRLNPRNP